MNYKKYIRKLFYVTYICMKYKRYFSYFEWFETKYSIINLKYNLVQAKFTSLSKCNFPYTTKMYFRRWFIIYHLCCASWYCIYVSNANGERFWYMTLYKIWHWWGSSVTKVYSKHKLCNFETTFTTWRPFLWIKIR